MCSSSPQPPGNLSSHCSGSLSLMIKSCRETGLVAQWLKCLTQESLASSCEPLKLGSVDPQMGRGLGICILNTTTPVLQPPPTPVSLSGKLRCQPGGLPLDCFCPQTRTQTLSPGPNGVEGAGHAPTAQISLSHPAQLYLHQRQSVYQIHKRKIFYLK